MNKELADTALAAIEKRSSEMSEEQKNHFAALITMLLSCYGHKPLCRGMLILADENTVNTFGINADEFEMNGMIETVRENVHDMLKHDAPAQGMMN